jgi:hypothetical protein
VHLFLTDQQRRMRSMHLKNAARKVWYRILLDQPNGIGGDALAAAKKYPPSCRLAAMMRSKSPMRLMNDF